MPQMARSTYHPVIGRWITPQARIGRSSRPQSLNKYTYSSNNPSSGTISVTVWAPAPGISAEEFNDAIGSLAGGANAINLSQFRSHRPDHPSMTTVNQRFQDCLSQCGDSNASNLTYSHFADARVAARIAGIDPASLLAIWSIENSLNETFPATGPNHLDVGPIQITPPAQKDVAKYSVLPPDFGTNAVDNLIAGARYYSLMTSHYHLPQNEAAAGYHAGPGSYQTPDGQSYQANFNTHKANLSKLITCFNSSQ